MNIIRRLVAFVLSGVLVVAWMLLIRPEVAVASHPAGLLNGPVWSSSGAWQNRDYASDGDHGTRAQVQLVPGGGPYWLEWRFAEEASIDQFYAQYSGTGFYLRFYDVDGNEIHAEYLSPSTSVRTLSQVVSGVWSVRLTQAGTHDSQWAYVYEVDVYGSMGDIIPPAAPTGFMATAGDGYVDLSWQANSEGDLAGYRVYRDSALIADVTGTTYRDGLVTNGISYSYYVTAYDSNGNESSASTTVMATPVEMPPDPPTGLTASGGDGEVLLTWDAVEGYSYRVLRDGVEVAIGLTTGEYLDQGLTNGVTYTYEVITVSQSGLESSPASVSATPQEVPITQAPSLTANAVGSAVDLSWSPVAGADGYRVRRDGVVVADLTATSYRDEGLSLSTQYVYTVSAYNTLGEGPESDPITVQTDAWDAAALSGEASAGGLGFIQAGAQAWQSVWVSVMGLIALVFLAFWILRRTRKAAAGAR